MIQPARGQWRNPSRVRIDLGNLTGAGRMGRIERFFFDPQTRPLHHAVRLSAGAYFLGRLCVVLALLTAVPAVSCLIEGSWNVSVRYAALAAALAAFAAISSRLPKPAALMLTLGGVIFCGWLIFLVSGYQPLASLFGVTSAAGTVGLSSGITGPALEPGLKFTLCVLMLFGRVEIGPFLVLLFPGIWFGRTRLARG